MQQIENSVWSISCLIYVSVNQQFTDFLKTGFADRSQEITFECLFHSGKALVLGIICKVI